MAAGVGSGSATFSLDIANVTEHIVPNMATKWFEMGLQLGVSAKELSNIESDTSTSKKACIKMFTEWLGNSKTDKSWEKLLAALSSQSVRENTLADNLRDKIKTANKPSDRGIAQKKTPVANVVSGKEANAEMCEEALYDSYDNLTAALPIRSLLPKFISKRIIKFHDQDKILAGETDEDKRIRFLKHITDQLTSGSTDSFYKFLEILKKHGGSYSYLASDIEKRLDELQEATVTTEPVIEQDSECVHSPVQVEPSDVMEMTEKYSVINGASETIQYTAQNYPAQKDTTKHDGAKPPPGAQSEQVVPLAPPLPSMPAQAKLKLFISYGREEITNAFADRLHDDLRKQGWIVFLDKHKITWGCHISDTIASDIEKCDAMIIIFTKKYNNSEWCRKELELASTTKKKLFPLRRQDIPYPPLVNFHLGGLRWLDVFTDDSYDAVLKEIVETFKKLEKEIAGSN